MSIFLVDLLGPIGNSIEAKPTANLVHHESNERVFGDMEIPAENMIGVTRQYQVAPISIDLTLAYLAEHMRGLPQSF